jgi:PAS domain S-box-containing protein
MAYFNPWFVALVQDIALLMMLSLLYLYTRSHMRATILFQKHIDHMAIPPAPEESGRPSIATVIRQELIADRPLASALKESEERYERLADAAFEGLVFSKDGIIVDANARLAEMLGFSREELIGMPVAQIVAPDSRELVRRRMQSGYQGIYTHLALRKDGTTVPVEVRARRARYHGQPIRVTAIQDISERLAAQQALAASEARFRAIFERAAMGIVLLDLDGHAIESNPALQAMLGFSTDELRQMPCTGFTSPDDIVTELPLLSELVAGTREFYQFEKCYVRKDGQTVCGYLRISLIHDLEGAPLFVLAMVEDITERRLMEARYLEAQKMESLGRLAGGIAHDFNNMLTVILGNSDLLLADVGPGHPLYHDIAQIQQVAQRAAALTRQLLAFSRQQMLQPIVLDLNAMVTNVDPLLRRLIGEDITLVTQLGEPVGAIQADPSQLEQVLWNLVVNARDAMPAGGTLIIETSNVVLDASYTQSQNNVASGTYSMLAVSDTGVGMSADTQARIFEPFFTTKGASKGTGLGLATVYGIVKQSGGHIWVYSEIGHGTTFKIYLPHAVETQAIGTPAPAPVDVPRGFGTILLVEDHPQVRELAGRALRAQGYRVLEAADGSIALEIVTQHQGAIDLLLTDMIMPGGMSGRELAEQIRVHRPAMKVLFMSGYTDHVLVHHQLLTSHQDVLQKPFTPTALVRTVWKGLRA